MNADALTLAAVADEWRALLIGARIDTIIAPTGHAIALQCYAPPAPGSGQGGQNHWLYLSAHPQLARVHLTARKPTRIASDPSAFVMLLRKHLEGARIESIVQPRWERVIEIVAGRRAGGDPESPESLERVHYRLVIEVMGRMSNIVCCDEQGRILGSLKQVGAEINRYRVILPNVQYVPPPPQQRLLAGQTLPRLDPAMVTATQLRSAAEQELTSPPPAPAKKASSRAHEQPRLWQVLTKHLLGFSPLLARETVYRTLGDSEALPLQDESVWEELAWNVRDMAALPDRHAWMPQLVERGADMPGAPPLPVAFAPYTLEQYSASPGMFIRGFSSVNVTIDDYYAGAEWRDAMESLRAPLRRTLQTQVERCRRKVDVLQQELQVSEAASIFRLWGNLLLAYQNDVQQGQQRVVLQNFFEGEANTSPVTIPLDPRFDAVGNANRFFHKYAKLRRALALVPAQIEQNSVELATLEQLATDLVLAETPAELVLVKAEVQAAGYLRGRKQAGKGGIVLPRQSSKSKSGKQGKYGKQASGKGKPILPGGGVPLHVQSHDGFTILIGKNSRQNEEVTFHQASAGDIWLHARGVPGAHVIIKTGGRDTPRSTIEEAAGLAAFYSQARGSTSVLVDYTLQRYVRHMKGGGPGMVLYERERTLHAEPRGV